MSRREWVSRLVCCNDFKDATKARCSSPTDSSGVAISGAKNVTEYHAVALVSTRRLILDPATRSAGSGRPLWNLSDAHGLLRQHGAHLVEQIARAAPLTAEVSPVVILLRMLDAGSRCAALVVSACAWAVAAMKAISASRTITPFATLGSPINPRHPCPPKGAKGPGNDAQPSCRQLTTQRPVGAVRHRVCFGAIASTQSSAQPGGTGPSKRPSEPLNVCAAERGHRLPPRWPFATLAARSTLATPTCPRGRRARERCSTIVPVN
jgi:hypothetical protein